MRLTSSSYRLDPCGEYVERITGIVRGYWAPGVGTVVITYRAGVTGFDLSLARQGVKELLKHLWQTQRGSRKTNYSADEYDPGTAYSMPIRVAQLLEPLRVAGFA